MRNIKWVAASGCVILMSAWLAGMAVQGENRSDLAAAEGLRVARVRDSSANDSAGISVDAKAAALIDVSTGRILYEKNANERMRIASLTKIITAIVAIESGKMKNIVTIGPDAVGKEGSSIYLRLGEKLSLEDLVYAIMLRSGNDAATAIADYVGGSVPGFADMMNREMAKLGLTSSHFVNPHGLDHKDHYSTAHDMAVITAYALHNPEFAKIVSTRFKRIPWPDEGDRLMKNKNKMLVRYPGADGVKTGYTKLSGRCLVSSATRDGRQLAVVVLSDPSDWIDSERLLNYGFKDYPMEKLAVQGETIRTLAVKNGKTESVPVAAATSFAYPLYTGEKERVTRTIHLPTILKAPIDKGQKVGEMTFTLNGQRISTVPLLAAERVDRRGLWGSLTRLLTGFFSAREEGS